MQIYAPLDGSQFHRSLYIFSCVNATCSNQSKGWLCVRAQQLEKISDRDFGKRRAPPKAENINWCSGADEWDVMDVYEDYDEDSDRGKENLQRRDDIAVINEQNGNFVTNNIILLNNKNDNSMSEDEEESNSTDSDPIPSFGNLHVVDDKNANCGDQGAFLIILSIYLWYS